MESRLVISLTPSRELTADLPAVFSVYASHKAYVRARAIYDIATESKYKQEVMVNSSEEFLTRGL